MFKKKHNKKLFWNQHLTCINKSLYHLWPNRGSKPHLLQYTEHGIILYVQRGSYPNPSCFPGFP